MENRRKFLKQSLAALASGLVIDLSASETKRSGDDWNIIEDQNVESNPYNIDPEKVKWLKEATLKQLKARLNGSRF